MQTAYVIHADETRFTNARLRLRNGLKCCSIYIDSNAPAKLIQETCNLLTIYGLVSEINDINVKRPCKKEIKLKIKFVEF